MNIGIIRDSVNSDGTKRGKMPLNNPELFKYKDAEGPTGIEKIGIAAGLEHQSHKPEETQIFDKVAIFDAINNFM
jgi:hypothetical protein